MLPDYIKWLIFFYFW